MSALDHAKAVRKGAPFCHLFDFSESSACICCTTFSRHVAVVGSQLRRTPAAAAVGAPSLLAAPSFSDASTAGAAGKPQSRTAIMIN